MYIKQTSLYTFATLAVNCFKTHQTCKVPPNLKNYTHLTKLAWLFEQICVSSHCLHFSHNIPVDSPFSEFWEKIWYWYYQKSQCQINPKFYRSFFIQNTSTVNIQNEKAKPFFPNKMNKVWIPFLNAKMKMKNTFLSWRKFAINYR